MSQSPRVPLTAPRLRGVFVALVTPFTEEGAVDEPSLLALADWLLAEGVHGLVLAGTTGESPTLTWEEIERLFVALHARVAGRVPILVGTGTNDTATSVAQTRRAEALGADGALVVCPYYNRPSPAGVLAHYAAVAAVGLPTVAYHIPYRTGLALDRATLQAILAIPGVIGIKESTGGLAHIAALATEAGPAWLCGEDNLFLPALTVGAVGLISASANLFPGELVAVYDAFRAGDLPRARSLFARLQRPIELLFSEPNPAPLKWALSQEGRIASGRLRLPMVPVTEALARQLSAAFGATVRS